MKHLRVLFAIYILLLSIGTAFSQTVEVQGFLPNIEQITSLCMPTITNDAKSSTWSIRDINTLSPNRFTGANQWNNYPFILKIDSTDNLVWSTYFFSTQPILAMEVDSKDNLYIGGNTTDGNLPTKYKVGAYFSNKSLLPANNINRAIKYMERRSYIAEFNRDNTLIWCTYLESQADPGSTTYINDIDYQDRLLLTGYTTNTKFPLLKKEGAYYEDYSSISSVTARCAFIMAFKDNGSILWSTLQQFFQGRQTEGVDIEGLPDGRIRVLKTVWSGNNKSISLLEFESNYKLGRDFRTVHGYVFNFEPFIKNKRVVLDILGLEKYDYYNDIERLYNYNGYSTDMTCTSTGNLYMCLSVIGDLSYDKVRENNFILKDTISYHIFASNYCSKQEHTLKLNHFTDFNIKMLQPSDTAICKDLFPTEIYGLTTEQIDGKCYWLSENKEDTIEISPSRYISKDGTYPIILSDIYNCSQDYKITVSLKEDCSPKIDMPNVFTPNSDGINDEFKMISADNLKDFEITIFNKAGTKVYEYEGLIENFAWKGTYKNSARDVLITAGLRRLWLL